MGAPATRQREPIALHTAEAMLSHVDAHERETWLQVGMALHAEFGDAAFEAWDRWSSNAANYSERAARATWRGFKPGGVTIGTLVKLAMDGGYRFEASASHAPDPAELALRRAEREARLQAEAAQRARDHLAAEQVALAQWREALRTGRSGYAERKGIERPESCRFTPGGWLLVPAIRYDLPREQSLKGLQVIRPDGTKRFTTGMAKAGAACRLGLAEAGAPVLICEGWATGMSLRMATDRKVAVYVAFDAGNLPQVAAIVHQAHPDSPLVLCADDDWRTADRDGRPLNPGRVQATLARDAVQAAGGHALLAMPVFRPGRDPGSTDFNDLHLAEGVDAVREQMALALDVAREVKRG